MNRPLSSEVLPSPTPISVSTPDPSPSPAASNYVQECTDGYLPQMKNDYGYVLGKSLSGTGSDNPVKLELNRTYKWCFSWPIPGLPEKFYLNTNSLVWSAADAECAAIETSLVSPKGVRVTSGGAQPQNVHVYQLGTWQMEVRLLLGCDRHFVQVRPASVYEYDFVNQRPIVHPPGWDVCKDPVLGFMPPYKELCNN